MLKISVVITVYNLEAFLESALNSVLEQTYQPFEIIVIDDSSTDGSQQVLERFSDKIRYHRNSENQGVLLSTIQGVKMTKGDIICFLDGDDIWEKIKLQKVVDFFINEPGAVMVTHNHSYIDKYGAPIRKVDETHLNIERVLKIAGNDKCMLNRLLRESMLAYKGVWLGSAYAIKKSSLNIMAFEAWALSLPNPKLSYQDHPLAQYLILKNPEGLVGFINEPLLRYRIFGFNSSGASFNTVSALRTVTKLEATAMRTYNLVCTHPVDPHIVQAQKYKLQEANYLKDLYMGNNLRAIKLYWKLVQNKWSKEQALKELVRICGSLVLGKKLFFKLKEKV